MTTDIIVALGLVAVIANVAHWMMKGRPDGFPPFSVKAHAKLGRSFAVLLPCLAVLHLAKLLPEQLFVDIGMSWFALLNFADIHGRLQEMRAQSKST